jgi:hypothetical protein
MQNVAFFNVGLNFGQHWRYTLFTTWRHGAQGILHAEISDIGLLQLIRTRPTMAKYPQDADKTWLWGSTTPL